MKSNFRQSRQFGDEVENGIAGWLARGGYTVVPMYQFRSDEERKGPAVITPHGVFVAPDLFIYAGLNHMWVEAKGKAHFTWHRLSQTWQAGIDRGYYRDYVSLANQPGAMPLWILFLCTSELPSEDDVKADCPEHCPTGLYGGKILHLQNLVHHESDHYGPTGMVYWCESVLWKIADVGQMAGACRRPPTNAGESPIEAQVTG